MWWWLQYSVWSQQNCPRSLIKSVAMWLFNHIYLPSLLSLGLPTQVFCHKMMSMMESGWLVQWPRHGFDEQSQTTVIWVFTQGSVLNLKCKRLKMAKKYLISFFIQHRVLLERFLNHTGATRQLWPSAWWLVRWGGNIKRRDADRISGGESGEKDLSQLETRSLGDVNWHKLLPTQHKMHISTAVNPQICFRVSLQRLIYVLCFIWALVASHSVAFVWIALELKYLMMSTAKQTPRMLR